MPPVTNPDSDLKRIYFENTLIAAALIFLMILLRIDFSHENFLTSTLVFFLTLFIVAESRGEVPNVNLKCIQNQWDMEIWDGY